MNILSARFQQGAVRGSSGKHASAVGDFDATLKNLREQAELQAKHQAYEFQMAAQTTCEERQAEIPALIRQNSRAIENLHERLNVLEMRLEPVMTPIAPSPNTDCERQDVRTELGGDLAYQSVHIAAAAERVEAILRRLEV